MSLVPHDVAPSAETSTVARWRPAPGGAALLPDAVAVLAALDAPAFVVGSGDAVMWAEGSAVGLGLVVDDAVADPALAAAVTEVRRDGLARWVDVSVVPRRRRGRRPVLVARVAPLDGQRTLVVVEDRSEARRVDDVRRDFVANVSHELKTPVGALSLLAEAAAEAADDPEAVRRFAGRMQQEAARLSQLVNELIDLSRLQSDDPLSHATVVDVRALVADAADRVRTTANAKRIELKVAISEDDLVVFGDGEQLTQALRNLLDNAVSYSPEGTHVTVSARHGDGVVELHVADQGIGIPERDLERIFERFYRVDAARSRITGGTGLGLSIVKHVAQNHGGQVSVWSVEGAGSTFTLRLPTPDSFDLGELESAPPGAGPTPEGAP